MAVKSIDAGMEKFTINCEIRGNNIEVSYMLDPKGAIGAAIQAGVPYEPEVTLFLLRVLKDEDVFVDIGAHVGYFSMLAARLVGEKGQVVSFEPEKGNRRHLQMNMDLNRLLNIRIFQRPVAEKSEMRTFYTNSDADGGHALWDPGLFRGNKLSKAKSLTQIMETITLDEAIEKTALKKTPKVIKIDTEGAEKSVLEGAQITLREYRVPFVICELHEFGLRQLGSSQEALRSLMMDCGYKSFLIPPSGGFPKLVPHGVQIKSKVFLNILFSRTEWLAPYWPVEFVNPETLR